MVDDRDNRIKRFLKKSKEDGYIVKYWGVSAFITFMESKEDAQDFLNYMKDCIEDYFSE